MDIYVNYTLLTTLPVYYLSIIPPSEILMWESNWMELQHVFLSNGHNKNWIFQGLIIYYNQQYLCHFYANHSTICYSFNTIIKNLNFGSLKDKKKVQINKNLSMKWSLSRREMKNNRTTNGSSKRCPSVLKRNKKKRDSKTFLLNWLLHEINHLVFPPLFSSFHIMIFGRWKEGGGGALLKRSWYPLSLIEKSRF